MALSTGGMNSLRKNAQKRAIFLLFIGILKAQSGKYGSAVFYLFKASMMDKPAAKDVLRRAVWLGAWQAKRR
jgi:hypothetical protein